MQKFVRGNQIVCSGKFTPVSGSAETTEAEAVIVYTDDAGNEQTETITLTDDGDGNWTGTFDSSLCKEMTDQEIDWVIRSTEGIIATSQGTFRILANRANS